MAAASETDSESLPVPTDPKAREFSPGIRQPQPVMLPRCPISDHALQAGNLVDDGPAAEVCGSVPVRVHGGDPIARLSHEKGAHPRPASGLGSLECWTGTPTHNHSEPGRGAPNGCTQQEGTRSTGYAYTNPTPTLSGAPDPFLERPLSSPPSAPPPNLPDLPLTSHQRIGGNHSRRTGPRLRH